RWEPMNPAPPVTTYSATRENSKGPPREGPCSHRSIAGSATLPRSVPWALKQHREPFERVRDACPRVPFRPVRSRPVRCAGPSQVRKKPERGDSWISQRSDVLGGVRVARARIDPSDPAEYAGALGLAQLGLVLPQDLGRVDVHAL